MPPNALTAMEYFCPPSGETDLVRLSSLISLDIVACVTVNPSFSNNAANSS